MMRSVIFILSFLMLLFFSVKSKAQEIDWNKINSNNIMEIITMQNPDLLSASSALQIGNHNHAELLINEKTNIVIQQLGSYNTLFYINSFSDNTVKNNITTQGNNNIIDITGSNSISENMRLNVKGDNVTIFMRNY